MHCQRKVNMYMYVTGTSLILKLRVECKRPLNRVILLNKICEFELEFKLGKVNNLQGQYLADTLSKFTIEYERCLRN